MHNALQITDPVPARGIPLSADPTQARAVLEPPVGFGCGMAILGL
jgi:hypothetical protein